MPSVLLRQRYLAAGAAVLQQRRLLGAGIKERGNAYELANRVGDHPEILGAAALRDYAGRDHLVVQPSAEEAAQRLRRSEGDPEGNGRFAPGSLLRGLPPTHEERILPDPRP